MAYEFKFPDVGEGITEGELLSWKVKEGDEVAENQTLAEVETDKAVVEVPSPKAGRIAGLHAQEGDIIKVGQVLVTIEEAGAPAEAAPPAQPGPEERPPAATPAAPSAAPEGQFKAETPEATAGAKRGEEGAEPVPSVEQAAPAAPAAPAPPAQPAPPAAGAAGAREKEAAGAEEPKAEAPARKKYGPYPPNAQLMEAEEFYTGSVVGRLEEAPEESAAGGPAAQAPAAPKAERPAPSGVKVLALPSVRALAEELGVDLTRVQGTGPGGRILRQDVEDYAAAAAYGRERVQAPAVKPEEMERAASCMGGCLEEDSYGVVERTTFRGVRRTMAKKMHESLAKQAQVTEIEEADATALKRIREKERKVTQERGIHLTYLAFVVKACTMALQRFPRLNATLSESCDEFFIKRYYNIGLAIDTSAGLVVPNIKNADQKSIFDLAQEITEVVERAQQRKLSLEDLRGGTFTVSNYGAIGGIYATPVSNYPEVAVMGMGRVRDVVVPDRGSFVVRSLLPLSLTFDHQLIDGAEAARFLNLVVNYIEDPDLMLLEGA